MVRRFHFPVMVMACAALLLGGCGPSDVALGRQSVKASWQALEAALDARRTDLEELLERLADTDLSEANAARTALAAREPMVPGRHPMRSRDALRSKEESEAAISGASERLIRGVADLPPALLSPPVLDGRARLRTTQRRVAAAWRGYADAVRDYNQAVGSLDGWLWSLVIFFEAGPRPEPRVQG